MTYDDELRDRLAIKEALVEVEDAWAALEELWPEYHDTGARWERARTHLRTVSLRLERLYAAEEAEAPEVPYDTCQPCLSLADRPLLTPGFL